MHPPRRVTVTIDRLVLRGFALEQRDGIAAALTTELRRQFANTAVANAFQQGRSSASLRAVPLMLRAAATPTEIGTLGARYLIGSMRP